MKLTTNILGKSTIFINDSCNYQCSYCTTTLKAKSAGLRVDNCKLFMQRIKKHVPRGWHFLISGGGEPFLHPDFFYIIRSLIKSGYLISINTNFSSPINDLKKFLKITKGKLICLISSLHLEFSNSDIFIDKIIALKKSFPDFSNYCVVSVALPGRLDQLKEIHLKFKKAGIKIELQPLRKITGEHFKYSKEQQEKINQINSKLKKIRKIKSLRVINGKNADADINILYCLPLENRFVAFLQ
jgi:MoaA/NifB/PqqE/SkfB family radical SAM enzyme